MMSELAEHFAPLQQERRERNERNFEENLQILRASGLSFKEHATSVIFREAGMPKVDFYPHTGKWCIPGTKTKCFGGAKAFLKWYAKIQQRRLDSAYWRFECEDWCSSYIKLPSKPTLESLFPHMKSEGWNGKMHNYRVVDIPGTDDVEVHSNLSCGEPCEWHVCHVIKKVVPDA